MERKKIFKYSYYRRNACVKTARPLVISPNKCKTFSCKKYKGNKTRNDYRYFSNTANTFLFQIICFAKRKRLPILREKTSQQQRTDGDIFKLNSFNYQTSIILF